MAAVSAAAGHLRGLGDVGFRHQPVVRDPSAPSARYAWLVLFFGNDLIAQIDALVADIDAGSSNELFDLFLALPAKRAGQIGLASFAAALLPAADVAIEAFLDRGDAHAEVVEHPPGMRTRIKRQRGEQVLGAHVAAPGLLRNRGRTPDRLSGLGRLLWRPLAGRTFSSCWEQLLRGGAHRVGPSTATARAAASTAAGIRPNCSSTRRETV
jgi:hypothetical protein